MIRALARALSVAVGIGAFLIAEALKTEQSRGLVAALFPSDDEFVAFLADPMGAFPGADPRLRRRSDLAKYEPPAVSSAGGHPNLLGSST